MVKRTLVLMTAVVLATPIVSLAQQADEGIFRSVERKALAMELRSEGAGSRRSGGRTWTGVAMIAAGVALTTAKKTTEACRGGVCTYRTEWIKSAGHPGMGLAVAGVLLATVWSDVPANPHLDVAVTPDGVQVGKTFGF